MVSRRNFIYSVAASGVFLSLNSCGLLHTSTRRNTDTGKYFSIVPDDSSILNNPHPDGKRSSFGWNYFEISGQGTKFRIDSPDNNSNGEALFLRLMIAHEVRDKREVEVSLGDTGRVISTLPIWYANTLQIFECELKATLDEVMKEGIRITQVSDSKEFLYCYLLDETPGSHIFLPDGKEELASQSFISTISSLWSIQPFGWMEGCITDGLEALINSGKYPKLKRHLKQRHLLFLPDSQTLKYENYHGQPVDNKFSNWEGGLPFASMVKLFPDHPAIDLFTNFCENRIVNGETTGKTLTTEGCYHLAYPLATVSKIKGNKDWCDIALIELTERIRHLTGEGMVIQRAAKNGLNNQFVNWSRGYAWFLLGLVQTYRVVHTISGFENDSRLPLIREAFETYADLAIRHQMADGTWRAFIDDDNTSFDASGTAGIAAALMYGYRMGWKVDFDRKKQMRVLSALEGYLTADGFLKNSCQVNRGGEELQRGTYRVIAQYSLGMMAHLYT